MKLRIQDSTAFINIMKALNTVTDEATFHIKPKALTMRTMDPSRTLMVDFELSKEAFDEYEVKEELELALSIRTLLKLLKRATKDDALELSLQEPKLRLAFIRENDVREFLMNTLEPEAEEDLPTPKIVFNVQAKFLNQEFNRRIQDATLASDHVYFIADPQKMILEAKGNFLDSKTEIKKGSDMLLSLETKEPSKAIYSLLYLSELFNDCSQIAKIVTIEFSKDMPLKLSFEMNVQGKLIYYLAPRIEVD